MKNIDYKREVEIMEAEKTKKARKPRKQPKVHVEVSRNLARQTCL